MRGQVKGAWQAWGGVVRRGTCLAPVGVALLRASGLVSYVGIVPCRGNNVFLRWELDRGADYGVLLPATSMSWHVPRAHVSTQEGHESTSTTAR